ncbi:MAG: hypothetical protein JSS67_03520 [Bacteroidetes bacterium]|nr:hypothetical protein [Bacteroidota bacterium]
MMDLEDLLLRLNTFGKPSLHRMDKGWWCSIDMFVSAKGTDFKIKSEWDCATPTLAVQQCLQRVAETVGSVKAMPTLSVAP